MYKKGIGETSSFTRKFFPKGKKGAIGLSINFIVIVVISLVILGLGIAFLYQLVGGAKETKAILDSKTQSQLERLLVDEGKKVALPSHSASVYPGDFKSFAIGVLNIDETDFGKTFNLDVKLSKAFDSSDKEISNSGADSWLIFDKGPYTIEENDNKIIPIGINVPKTAKKGTYIFNAEVKCTCVSSECTSNKGCTPYDSIKKFTVVVK